MRGKKKHGQRRKPVPAQKPTYDELVAEIRYQVDSNEKLWTENRELKADIVKLQARLARVKAYA